MNIIVTVKQVADPNIPPAHIQLDPDGKRIVSPFGVPPVMNGYDANALEEALRYARSRKQFGQPIGNFQTIQFQLADIATELEAARMLTWKAADMRDRAPRVSLEAAMAKLFASETAERICSDAIQVFGGYGYVNDFPVERIYRDVRVCQIYEGTSDIQKILIGRALSQGL